MALSRAPSAATRRVLKYLFTHGRDGCHGYEISKQSGVKAGTLYPMLIRLEQQGLLCAEWEKSEGGGRPPRHIYRLSAEGYAVAAELAQAEDGQSISGKDLRGFPA